MQLRLQTCPETLAFLRGRNVAYHVEETNDAVILDNQLVERGSTSQACFTLRVEFVIPGN